MNIYVLGHDSFGEVDFAVIEAPNEQQARRVLLERLWQNAIYPRHIYLEAVEYTHECGCSHEEPDDRRRV